MKSELFALVILALLTEIIVSATKNYDKYPVQSINRHRQQLQTYGRTLAGPGQHGSPSAAGMKAVMAVSLLYYPYKLLGCTRRCRSFENQIYGNCIKQEGCQWQAISQDDDDNSQIHGRCISFGVPGGFFRTVADLSNRCSVAVQLAPSDDHEEPASLRNRTLVAQRQCDSFRSCRWNPSTKKCKVAEWLAVLQNCRYHDSALYEASIRQSQNDLTLFDTPHGDDESVVESEDLTEHSRLLEYSKAGERSKMLALIYDQFVCSSVAANSFGEIHSLNSNDEIWDPVTGWSVVHYTAKTMPSDLPIVIHKCSDGDWNLPTRTERWTLVHILIMNNRTDVLFELVSDNSRNLIDWDAADSKGKTPLIMAAKLNNTQILKVLLSFNSVSSTNSVGIEVNARDILKYSALHYAAENGNLEAVRLLIEAGAKINIWSAGSESGRTTPLHLALAGGHRQIVCLLLESGANAMGMFSQTTGEFMYPPYNEILHSCSRHSNNEEIVKLSDIVYGVSEWQRACLKKPSMRKLVPKDDDDNVTDTSECLLLKYNASILGVEPDASFEVVRVAYMTIKRVSDDPVLLRQADRAFEYFKSLEP